MKFFDCRRFAGVLLLLAITCGGCTGKTDNTQKQPITSIQQLNDPAYTIAVSEAGAFLEAVKRDIPRAKRLYLNGQSAYDAVTMGRADAYAFDRRQMEIAIAEGLKGVRILPGSIGEKNEIAVGISRATKIPDLKNKINTFIAELRADGTLQDMSKRWTVDRNYTMPDIPVPEKADTKLVVGTTGLVMPYSYYEGDRLTGYDVELSRRFAKWLGAGLEFKVYSFDGAVAAANAGDVDCVMSNLNVTPERAERIDFSDVLYAEEIALMVKDDASDSGSEASGKKGHSSAAEYDGKRIGVFTGTVQDQSVMKLLPNAKVLYFDVAANAVSAVNAGKIDALALDDQMAAAIERENPSVRYLDDYLQSFDYAFITAKTPEGDKLRTQLNEFIRSMKADGTLAQIKDIWTGTDENRKTLPNYKNYPDTNGTIRIAAESETPPFTYIKEGRIVGYEIDILVRFCKAYGYKPDIDAVTFPAIIPAVMSEKYLIGASNFSITEERKENVNFTEPTYTGGTVLLVNKTPEDTTDSTAQRSSTKPQNPRLAALNGQKIGVFTGLDEWTYLVHKLLPASEVVFFNEYADMTVAMLGGKIAAFVCDTPVLDLLMLENKNIASVGIVDESIDIAVGFPKSEKYMKLKTQWDEFITALKKNGELDSVISKWTNSVHTDNDIPDYESLPAPNGVLKTAADGTNPPFSYYIGNKIAGFEIELATKFCEAYGYGLDIDVMTYEAVLAAINSGKCDFALAELVPSGEHAENLLFSIPYYACATSLAIPADSPVAKIPASAPAVQTPEVLSPAAAQAAEVPAAPIARFSSIHDLAKKKIGVTVGTTNAQTVEKFIPDADIEYFDSRADVLTALKLRKVDAVCMGYNSARFLLLENEDLAMLGGSMENIDAAPIFAKTAAGQKLCAQFNEFLNAQRANGFLDELDSIWFGSDNTRKTAKDYSRLPTTNGTLKMATDTALAPLAYIKDNKILGYEVDCAMKFCEEYGYGLEIMSMNFGAIIPAVLSGKCDFGACNISITQERAENVLFSVPNVTAGDAIVVRKEDIQPLASEVSAPVKNTPVSGTTAPSLRTKLTSIADLAGKRIAVVTGTTHPQISAKYVPTAELVYFNNVVDAMSALKAKKVDAVCTGTIFLRHMMAEDDSVAPLGEQLTFTEGAPMFPKTEKGRRLCEQFSEFAKSCWDNGTIKELESIWFDTEESKRFMKDYSALPSPNGVLRMAVNEIIPPCVYMKDNRIVGYDVDFVVRFCEAYGYGLKVIPMSFAGIIPALNAGRCDFGIGAITITDERKENMLFSYPNLKAGNVFAVRKSDLQPSAAAVSASSPRTKLAGIAELSGKKIAVVTGTPHDSIALRYVPDAKLEFFDTAPDTFAAVKNMKADAVCATMETAKMAIAADDSFAFLGEQLTHIEAAPIFPKTEEGRKLCAQFSEFIKTLWDDGTVQKVYDIWLGTDDTQKTVRDYRKFTAPNGTLKLAVDSTLAPYVYVKDNMVVGYDVDLIARFCELYGYGLEIVPMKFAGIIPVLQSGKCDFGTGCFTITEERKENVLFSYPMLRSGNVFVVRKSDPQFQTQALSAAKHSTLSPRPSIPKRSTRTPARPSAPATRPRLAGIADLAGKRIGVQTGTTHPQITLQYVPTAELVYFNDVADTLTALKTKKIDAMCTSLPFLREINTVDDSIVPFGEQLTFVECAPIFAKTEAGRKLCDQFNEFTKACWEDGTIQELESFWLEQEESKRVMRDYSDLPSPNGILRLAAEAASIPFVYMKDNRIVGYDIDFVVRFCEKYGYGLRIDPMSFSAIIPAVNGGKCDLGIGVITITDERKENVLFSYPNAKTGNIFAVRKEDVQPKTQEVSSAAGSTRTPARPSASAEKTRTPAKKAVQAPRARFVNLKDLSRKKIGVTKGSINPQIAIQNIPDAVLMYFDNDISILEALKTRKIDAACLSLEGLDVIFAENDTLTVFGKTLNEDYTAPIFPKTEKGRKLCDQFSEFIKSLWDNGTVQKVYDIWLGTDDTKKTVRDYTQFTAPNGTLKLAVDTEAFPVVYVKDNKIVGYDIDLIARFCEAYGYGLKIVPMIFADIIPSVMSGKCDFGTGSIGITDERKESILFSYPFMKGGNVFIVRKEDIQSPDPNAGLTNINELNGKRIGVQTGTFAPQAASKYIPMAKLVYFDTQADLAAALQAGKIDALCSDIPTVRFMMAENTNMTMLGEPLTENNCAPVFPKTDKGRKLRDQFTEFTKTCWDNGTIKELESIWYGSDDSKRVVKDYTKLSAPNGVLKMAADSTLVPFTYIKDNRVVGYDVDFAVRFCEAYGYGLEIHQMTFAGIIPAVMSGKCDFAAGSITITEERAENVLFAEPNVKSGAAIFIKEQEAQIKKQEARTQSQPENQTQPLQTSGARFTDIADLAGKKVAVQIGSITDQIVSRFVSTAELVYFDNNTDLVTALKTGKVDALCTDIPIAKFMMTEYRNMVMLGEPLTEDNCAPIFPKTDKGRKLCAQFSEFAKTCWENGTIQELESIWYGSDDSKRVVKDHTKLPATNGVLKMAVDPTMIPFAYVKNNMLVGYDMDFVVRFCEAYGYGLEIHQMTFAGLIPALLSGKCDFATSCITYTEERAENVLFAEPNVKSGVAFFVRQSESQPQPETQPQTARISGARFTDIADIAGKKVAVQTGTITDQILSRFVSTAELVYFDNTTDLVTALKTGKVDALCTDIPIAKFMMSEYRNMVMLGDPLTENNCSSVFPKTDKGRKLCAQFSEFAKTCWENGTIQELESIWYGSDDSKRVMKDYTKLPAPNGVLKMAVDTSVVPFAYVKNNMIVGYEVDFAVRFCEAYGYGLTISTMSFAGLIPAVISGKCDFAASCIAYTEERAENILFAEPSVKSGVGVFVRQSDTQSQAVQTSEQYTTLEELADKRIGVQTGTVSAMLVEEKLPNAKIQYFDALPDILIALKTGKIDALATTIFSASYMVNTDSDVTIMDQWLKTTEISPIFTKSDRGRKLCNEYSDFLKGLWEDGTIDQLNDIWLGSDESSKIVKDYSNLPAPNGTIRLAVDTSMPPLAYVKDNRIVGYDIDLAVRFCEANGYGLKITQNNVIGILAEVMSGKSDLTMSLIYTEERAESALFPQTASARSGNVIVVMKDKSASAAEESTAEGEYSTFEELADKMIGSMTGTPNDKYALQAIPTAKIQYFDTFADTVTALRMHRIEAASIPLNSARFMLIYNEDLTAIGKPLAELNAAPIFAKTDKGRQLCEQYSKFIDTQKENGTLQELDSIWFGRDESKRIPKDYASLPAPNGVLKMAVDTTLAPFAYVKDNKIVGYEIECAVKFCQEHGYGLEVIPMNFGALIAAVQSGKCDFASCTIAITPEREEQVLFASPNAKTGCVLVVRKAQHKPQVTQPKTETPSSSLLSSSSSQVQVSPQTQASPSQASAFMEDARVFFEELKASFNRTFIRENRWQLFVDGIIDTMIITVLSIVFGTILGFVVYLFCRGGNVIANLITRFFVWLIEGTPMVVLLMILYYIIFGKVDIPGIWVAIIAFTLTFGAGFYGMLLSGTSALDKGQTEAAYALGFTDTQTFFTVILPQAALHFMPAYKSSVVALIKATAIVGYIAVQDLTKMGDIVRSRTYEAFFPLISVAAIYFVLAGVLNFIVGIIHNRIRPEKRTKDDILKGVDSHD